MDKISFTGKTVLITGSAQGIGRAIAEAFIKHDASKIYCLDRNEKSLDEFAKACPQITPVKVDIKDWNTTRACVQKLGAIDILINNAGITHLAPFTKMNSCPKENTTAPFTGTIKHSTWKLDDIDISWLLIIDVNLKAAVCVSQVAIESMIKQGKGGAIVSLSSQAAKIPLDLHTAYGISKAGINIMSQQIALEYGKYNIRSNTVCPTIVMTEMGRQVWSDPAKQKPFLDRMPLGRFPEVYHVVNVIIFLASDASEMINGHHLPIDGGILAV